MRVSRLAELTMISISEGPRERPIRGEALFACRAGRVGDVRGERVRLRVFSFLNFKFLFLEQLLSCFPGSIELAEGQNFIATYRARTGQQ